MKNTKTIIIAGTAAVLTIWWIILVLTGSQEGLSNALWQVLLAAAAILYAGFGFQTSGRWSWLKSTMGKGTFFISLGLLAWGLGQAGWAYYTIAQPDIDVPRAPILDFLYFMCVPFWGYGVYQLSHSTGAKYGLKKPIGKLYAASVFTIIAALSYYFLIIVARGGLNAYFDPENLPTDALPIWYIALTDLGYALGDAAILAMAISIYGLSWKYLGGRFKRPILGILFGFSGMYVADFFFSYYDGLGEYYNGHWTDVLFLAVTAVLGISLVYLYPPKNPRTVSSTPIEPVANPLPLTTPAENQTVQTTATQGGA